MATHRSPCMSHTTARRWETSRHVGNLVRREPTGSVGHVGDHVIVVTAVDAADRQGEIVGRTLSFQLPEHREIEHLVRNIDTSPQRLAAHAHPLYWIVLVRDQVGDLVGDEPLLALAARAPPDEGGPKELRVQRPVMECHPQQWQAGRQHPPSEFIKGLQARWNLACRSDQPFGDGIQAVLGRPLGNRAFDHSRGYDIASVATSRRMGDGSGIPPRKHWIFHRRVLR